MCVCVCARVRTRASASGRDEGPCLTGEGLVGGRMELK